LLRISERAKHCGEDRRDITNPFDILWNQYQDLLEQKAAFHPADQVEEKWQIGIGDSTYS
jgi:hypothetical protein